MRPPSSTMRRSDPSAHAPTPGPQPPRSRHHLQQQQQQQQPASASRSPTHGRTTSSSHASSSGIVSGNQALPSSPGSSQDNAIILSPDASPSPGHAGVPSSFADGSDVVVLPEGPATKDYHEQKQNVQQASSATTQNSGQRESFAAPQQLHQSSSNGAAAEATHHSPRPITEVSKGAGRSGTHNAGLLLNHARAATPPVSGVSEASRSPTSANQPFAASSKSKSPLGEAGLSSRTCATAASQHTDQTTLEAARSLSLSPRLSQSVQGMRSSLQRPSSMPAPSTSGSPFWTAAHDRLLTSAVQRWGLAFDAVQMEFNTSSNDTRSLKALKIRWRTLVLFSNHTPQLEAAMRVAAGKRPDGPVPWTKAELEIVRQGLAKGKSSSDIYDEYMRIFPVSTRSKAAVQGKASSLRKAESESGEGEDEQGGGDGEGFSQGGESHNDAEDAEMAGESSLAAARSPSPSTGQQQKQGPAASRAPAHDEDLIPDDEDEAFETESLMAVEDPQHESQAVEEAQLENQAVESQQQEDDPAEDQQSDDLRGAGEGSPSLLMLSMDPPPHAPTPSLQPQQQQGDHAPSRGLAHGQAGTSATTNLAPSQLAQPRLDLPPEAAIDFPPNDMPSLPHDPASGQGSDSLLPTTYTGALLWSEAQDDLLAAAVERHGLAFEEVQRTFLSSGGYDRTIDSLRYRWRGIANRPKPKANIAAAIEAAAAYERPQRPLPHNAWTAAEVDLLRQGMQQKKRMAELIDDYAATFPTSKRSRRAVEARVWHLRSEGLDVVDGDAVEGGGLSLEEEGMGHGLQFLSAMGAQSRFGGQSYDAEVDEGEAFGADSVTADSDQQLAAHASPSPFGFARTENNQQPLESRPSPCYLNVRISYEPNGVRLDGVFPGLEILVLSPDKVRLVVGDPTSQIPAAKFSSIEEQPAFHLRVEPDEGVRGLIVPQGTTMNVTLVPGADDGQWGRGGSGKKAVQTRVVGPCSWTVTLVMY